MRATMNTKETTMATMHTIHATTCAAMFPRTLACTAVAAEPTTAAPAPTAEAGMRVNIDPATGRMLETPAADRVQRRVVQRPPLAEQPSTAPEGGTMVILDDRFNSEMRVEVPEGSDPKAVPKADCGPAPQR